MNKLSSKEEKDLRSELNEFAAQLEKLFKKRGYWDEEKTLGQNLRKHQGELEQILEASGFKQLMSCLTIRNKLQHPDPNNPAHVSNPSQFARDANRLLGLLQDTLGGKVAVFNWDRVVKFWEVWPKTGPQVFAAIVAVVHFIYHVREPEQELLNTLHGSLYVAGISCFLSVLFLHWFREYDASNSITNAMWDDKEHPLAYLLVGAQDPGHFCFKVASVIIFLSALFGEAPANSDFWARLADSFFVTNMVCFIYVFVVDPFVIMRNNANLE